MFSIVDLGKIRLIFSPVKGFNTACLGVFIKVGSRYEKKNSKGIAHFLEHMLFKGSKNYSYKEIKREIEGRGGILNAFTSQETTGYYSQFLNKNMELTLDILLDMVMHPLMETNEIEKERNVILEEIKMQNDLPHLRVGILLDKLLWENHPLGEEIIGSFDTVKAINRKDLLMFKNACYGFSNMVIVCVADYDQNRLLSRIKEKTAVASTAAVKVKLTSYAPNRLRGIKTSLERKVIDQTHLCLGFRGPSYRSRDRLVVDLIHVILGANMSSRLFEEIREKRGLCYDVSTETRKFKDSGAFLIHLGLDLKNVMVAIKSIMQQLEKVKAKEVPNKELGRAKDYLLGQVAMDLERPQGRMFYMADSYLALNKIYTLEEIIELIKEITPARVRRVCRSIFDFNKLCLSCVTDSDDGLKPRIENLLKSL